MQPWQPTASRLPPFFHNYVEYPSPSPLEFLIKKALLRNSRINNPPSLSLSLFLYLFELGNIKK
jgi:hypothetical protein